MRLNLVGQRVGHLTVIAEAPRTIACYLGPLKAPQWQTNWVCKCDCGNEVVRPFRRLRTKRATVSCGCVKRAVSTEGLQKRGYDPLNANYRYILRTYKKMANVRGLAWELSDERARQLFAASCSYCGQPRAGVCRAHKGPAPPFIYNGIDRIDNTKGYVEGNVTTACKRCNRAKTDMSTTEFCNWVKSLSERLGSRFIHPHGTPLDELHALERGEDEIVEVSGKWPEGLAKCTTKRGWTIYYYVTFPFQWGGIDTMVRPDHANTYSYATHRMMIPEEEAMSDYELPVEHWTAWGLDPSLSDGYEPKETAA